MMSQFEKKMLQILQVCFNQPLNNWNVSNVTDMNRMFHGAILFNQLLNWNVSNVTDTRYMFEYAESFNQSLAW